MGLKKILIAGEGGQGIQTLAKILSSTAFACDKLVTFLPNFGIEQRGGVSLAFIQISDRVISFPKFQKADIVVILAPRAISRVKSYFEKDTVLIFDNSLISESEISEIKAEKVAIPASNIAKEKLIPKVFNVIILGALTAEIGGLSWQKAEKEIISGFADKIKKEPQLKHFNIKAFEIGEDIMKGLKN